MFNRFSGEETPESHTPTPLPPVPTSVPVSKQVDDPPAISPPTANSRRGTAELLGHYSPGSRIGGRYDVVRMLEGGMGLVYLCTDQQNGARPVALKTFKPNFLPDRGTRDRFLREGTIWVALGNHPNIVHAQRVERMRNGLEIYLVLEWVAAADETLEDASLRAMLQARHNLPPKDALTYGLHIARGMNHATAQIPGLIHRDMKPENVLIGRDGIARVTDFGLASVLAALHDMKMDMGMHIRTSDGGVGTPLYMAPEQWKREATIDFRADIYAFGCILYEMLTGQLAISGTDAAEVARAHQLGRVNPLPPKIPKQVQSLVRGCMAINPAHRFQSWQDLETAISLVYKALLHEEPPALVDINAEIDDRGARIAAGWSYNAVGLSYRDIGNHDLAAGYFERVIFEGQASHDFSLVSAGLRNLGDAYRELGDLDRAVKRHYQQAELAKKINDILGECDALGSLGKDFMRQQAFEQAMNQFRAQLTLVEKLNDPYRKCVVLNNIGDAYLALNEPDKALPSFERALASACQIEDRLFEGRILSNIGRIYVELNQSDIATTYLESALDIAREVGDRTGEGLAMGSLGVLQSNLGNSPRALWYLVNQLAIAQETRDQVTELAVSIDLGNVYLKSGNFEQAIEAFHSALKIVKEQGNRKKTIYLLGRLGLSYFKSKATSRAIGYYEEGLVLAQEIGAITDASELAWGVAHVYYSIENYWRTNERYEQALTLAKEAEALQLWAQIGHEFAILMARQNNRERALFYAQESIRIFESLGENEAAKEAKNTINRIKSWWRKP